MIGSTAILAVLPDPPDPPEGVLMATRDVNIFPLNDESERIADQITYFFAEAGKWDIEYGYHAQGISLHGGRKIQRYQS